MSADRDLFDGKHHDPASGRITILAAVRLEKSQRRFLVETEQAV